MSSNNLWMGLDVGPLTLKLNKCDSLEAVERLLSEVVVDDRAARISAIRQICASNWADRINGFIKTHAASFENPGERRKARALAAFLLGRYRDARKLIGETARDFRQSPLTAEEIGNLLFHTQEEACLAAYGKSLTPFTKPWVEAHHWAARRKLANGLLEEALEIYRELALQSPRFHRAHTWYLRLASVLAAPVKAQGIPKRIVQYWDTDPPPTDVAEQIAAWTAQNPEFEHRLYNKESAKEYLVENFGESYGAILEECVHPAQESDFFRLAVIYREGGIYVDADDMPIAPLPEDLLQHDLLLFWVPQFDVFANGFFAARQRQPLIKVALETCAKRIDGSKETRITYTSGPGMFTESMARYYADHASVRRSEDVHVMGVTRYDGFARKNVDLEYRKSASGNWLTDELERRG